MSDTHRHYKNKEQIASLISPNQDVTFSSQIWDDSVFKGTLGNPSLRARPSASPPQPKSDMLRLWCRPFPFI